MRYAFILTILMIFTSCLAVPVDSRMVDVSIPVHPWERECGRDFFYTLEYTRRGKIRKLHVPSGRRNVSIMADRRRNTFVCAYPLGRFNPAGGYLEPDDDSVTLEQKMGRFSSFMMEMSCDSQSPFHVNCDRLVNALERHSALETFDASYLASDMLNGCLSEKSIVNMDNVSCVVSDLPWGTYIGERGRDDRFRIGPYGEGAVALHLPYGKSCYLEPSLGICVIVMATDEVIIMVDNMPFS